MTRSGRVVALVAVVAAASFGACSADGSEAGDGAAGSSTTVAVDAPVGDDGTAAADDGTAAADDEPLTVSFDVTAFEGGPAAGLVGSGPEACVGDPAAASGRYRTWTVDAEVRLLDEADDAVAAGALGPGEALSEFDAGEYTILRCGWTVDLGPVPEASFYALEVAGEVVHTFDGGDRRGGELVASLV